MPMSKAETLVALGMPAEVAKAITTAKPQVAAIVALTDSSGGTASDTVEVIPAAVAAVTDTTAASLASVNTMRTAIQNDIADLAAKFNALLAALKA